MHQDVRNKGPPEQCIRTPQVSLKRGGQLLDVTASMTRSMDEADEQGPGPTSVSQSSSLNGAAPMLNGGAAAPFSSPTSSGSVAGGISREAAEAVAALQSASTELWQVPRLLRAVRPSVLIRTCQSTISSVVSAMQSLCGVEPCAPHREVVQREEHETIVHATSQSLR